MNPQRGRSRRPLKEEEDSYVEGTRAKRGAASRFPTESESTEKGSPMRRRYQGKPQRKSSAAKLREATEGRQETRVTLLHFLMEEYRYGDALSKLYVGLLARTVIDQEPELLDFAGYNACGFVDDLLIRCGVRDYKPNRHTEAVRKWHPLTSGKI